MDLPSTYLLPGRSCPLFSRGWLVGLVTGKKAMISQEEEEEVEEEDLCDQQEKGTGGKKGRHGCPAAELKMMQKD